MQGTTAISMQRDYYGGGTTGPGHGGNNSGVVRFSPEELDKLDASQLGPADVPSVHIDTSELDNLEASIEGTLQAVRRESNPSAAYPMQPTTAMANFNPIPLKTPHYPVPFDAQPAIITPPDSSGKEYFRFSAASGHGGKQPQFLSAHQPMPASSRGSSANSATKPCDADRHGNLENQHRQQMEKLRQDLETMLSHQAQVIKLNNEIEEELQRDLATTKKELAQEKKARIADRERFESKINSLQSRIRELQDARLSRGGFSIGGSRRRDGDAGLEARFEQLQREHDEHTANLVRQFEQEKAATLQIIKTKVKAQVNLLVPRLRDKLCVAFKEKFAQMKESLASEYALMYEEKLRRMKQESEMERKILQRQCRERLEYDRKETVSRLRAKYELKLDEVRTECERRILQRVRSNRRSLSGRNAYLDDTYDDGLGYGGYPEDDDLSLSL